jgi:hypothetical protein
LPLKFFFCDSIDLFNSTEFCPDNVLE